MNPNQQDPRDVPILVVDDEAIVRESLSAWFEEDGYDVDLAANAHDALRMSAAKEYAIALVDIRMPKMDGLELQDRLLANCPGLTLIIMTAYASVETAVRALKAGAYDYIVKPFDPDDLSRLIQRAREHRSLESENTRLKQSLEAAVGEKALIGESPSIHRVLELVRTVSASDSTVLIQGESGTGKELVAGLIHSGSPRRYSPLVLVHCGALAEGVLESELFGHEKGAFTGARYHHKGKFEQADTGTIFLDEIGDISPKVQIELLRVLEEKKVTRVGGTKAIPVDFRILAATNRDLEQMVKAGGFREDLYWRLNVVTVALPPLRDRPGDIPLLARHFLEKFCSAMNQRLRVLSPEALEALESYAWPGNVRELQNAIERAVVLGTPPTVERCDLPASVLGGRGAPGGRTLAEVEIRHIEAILEETGWNVTRAARVLDVDRGTLYNKMHKHGLSRPAHEQKA